MVRFALVIGLLWVACQGKKHTLTAVSVAEFQEFVNETGYQTEAEFFGWSFVQKDLVHYRKVQGANWKVPNGLDSAKANMPVVQVSYKDALAYCHWKGTSLPSHAEYFQAIKRDSREVNSGQKTEMQSTISCSVLGNVWDLSSDTTQGEVRLLGGSYLCDKTLCNGTDPKRQKWVSLSTANSHQGFCVWTVSP